MKNNKGELLQQPYLDLARMRRDQSPYDDAILGFVWNNTPEGYVFWSCVNRGETPAIFEFQLAELEVWRKEKAEPEYKELYDDLKYEYHKLKSDYETAVTEAEEYAADLRELRGRYNELKSATPTRNWVAECAMAILSNTPAGYSSWDIAEAWASEGRKRGHLPKTDNA